MKSLVIEKKQETARADHFPQSGRNDLALAEGNGRTLHSQPASVKPKSASANCFWSIIKETYL